MKEVGELENRLMFPIPYNVYRARPTQDAMTVDLFAEITDICYAGCDEDSIVRLTIQPANQGPSSIRSNIPVSLYRKDGASYTFIAICDSTDRTRPPKLLPFSFFLPHLLFEEELPPALLLLQIYNMESLH